MTGRNLLAQLLIGFGLGVIVLYVIGSRASSMITLTGADARARPVATAESDSWDFGSVPAGKPLEARFNVWNDGDQRLLLRRANDGCECRLNGANAIMIEPRSHRTLVVHFDTTEFNGGGKVALNYQTNDPRRPLLTFTCSAQVHQP